ncbi:H-2 class II histocompatibility antigen gamma chain [Cynoglossus semilaevis]|uniref:CD74 molecule, major histocompatibility complex, class II invariant chain a n=1 Tax=Cynoglossus semilaevis TaxID=244447 RepID=A0A3P8VTN3_CYNSE|nr:HLA class II histocompatibility antigen gamma chain [Cynoglossus semilaevis]
MENTPVYNPQSVADTIGSQDPLIPQPRPRPSNSRALKVAGLTTLACLLLASQVFTAYMVFNQKQEISNLKKNSEKMSKQLTRSPQPNYPMRVPIGSLPLMMDFTQTESSSTVSPDTRLQETTVASVEKQLRDFLEDFQQPHFNDTFLGNLQSLKQDMNESHWKSFESWMRYWLIFQLAQQKPEVPTPEPTVAVKTKCQKEAESGAGKIGSFKPQCDSQGQYIPTQCWRATGFCWCVDKEGTPIEGTSIRGIPDCRGGRALSRRMFAPPLMQKTISMEANKNDN